MPRNFPDGNKESKKSLGRYSQCLRRDLIMDIRHTKPYAYPHNRNIRYYGLIPHPRNPTANGNCISKTFRVQRRPSFKFSHSASTEICTAETINQVFNYITAYVSVTGNDVSFSHTVRELQVLSLSTEQL